MTLDTNGIGGGRSATLATAAPRTARGPGPSSPSGTRATWQPAAARRRARPDVAVQRVDRRRSARRRRTAPARSRRPGRGRPPSSGLTSASGSATAEHARRAGVLHQPAARGDQPQRVFEREHAGQAGGRRTRRCCGRASPPAAMPHGIHSCASAYSTANSAGCVHGGSAEAVVAAASAAGAEDSVAQSRAQLRLEQLGAASMRGAEHRLGSYRPRAHADILRALAGEQERDRLRSAPRRALVTPLGARSPSSGDGVGASRHDDARGGARTRCPADLQRVGHVGEARRRDARRRCSARLRVAASSAVAVLADSTSSCTARGAGAGGGTGGLFEHDVRVGAADAERADAGAPRRRPRRPGAQPVVRRRTGCARSRARVGLAKCRLGGIDAVPQRQHRLDQPGDAGGGVEVADVGLDRAERAEAARRRVLGAERLRQRRDLDRVAERRAGAVRLDVADRVGVDAGDGERLGDRRRPGRRRSARCSRPSPRRRC